MLRPGAGLEAQRLLLGYHLTAKVWGTGSALGHTATAAFVITGYCRRWSVELAFFDSKQFLGLHEPRVHSARSVERAHPMAWFVGSLTILWYCVKGHEGSQVVRERRWYTSKVTPTFTDMLGALRLQM